MVSFQIQRVGEKEADAAERTAHGGTRRRAMREKKMEEEDLAAAS